MPVPPITPDAIQLLFGGGIVAFITALRSLIRGHKEDESLQADIQEKVSKMAEHWLEKAEERLTETEKRLTETEKRLIETEKRATNAERRLIDTEKRATNAERRLARAESRAAGAEAYAGQADLRANQLREEFNTYREEIEDHLRVVHSWIESGAKPPPPSWPKWLPINENQD